MEEVTRSNLKLSMPSRSRSALKEQALAAWRFQPSDTSRDQHADVAGMFQPSHPDMEIVVGALERELNSRPEEGVIIGNSSEKNSSEKIAGSSTSEVASSSMFSCDLGSPSQATVEAKAIASVEVSDSMAGQSEAPGTRTLPAEALSRSCNNQKSVPAMNNFLGKRRSRSGNRAPLTIMRADPAEFQAMVQQMTGLPLENSSRAAPSIFKPQPKRPGRIGTNIMPSVLTTLDSSSLGFPAAINGLFGTRPNYLHPAAFCNSLAQNSVYSAGTAASSSHPNSMGIDKANILQSQINGLARRDF
jgi:hypothetical protein